MNILLKNLLKLGVRMKITKANLQKELKHLKLLVRNYSSDSVFLNYLFNEITRVENELKMFDKKGNLF